MRLTLAVTIVLIACTVSPAATSAPSTSASASRTPSAASTTFGVAGLIRPNNMGTKAADFEAMYRSFTTTGGAVGFYTNWTDSAADEGAPPRVIAAAAAAAKQYGFGPLVIALGVARDAPGGVGSTVDWNGPQRERFIAAATAIAREQRPEYLALGVESNRLWGSDRAAWDGFVRGYASARDAIKAASPSTRVFTIFQLELMKGHAVRWTGRDDPPQWSLIDAFAGTLDVVGFTTYPFLEYARPADIPPGYFSDALDRVKVPVAFTEIGWPSARPASTPFAYDASPDAQAAFVDRFFALVPAGDRRVALALWSFPFDVGTQLGLFDSVALRASDGTAKPALAAWQRGIAGR